MDDYTKQLLEQWDMGIYVSTFADNSVDFLALKQLDEDCIRQLIPVVGHRAKFKANWKEWVKDMNKASEIQNSNLDASFDLDTFLHDRDETSLRIGNAVAESSFGQASVSPTFLNLDSGQSTGTIDAIPTTENEEICVVEPATTRKEPEARSEVINPVLAILQNCLDGRAILKEGQARDGLLQQNSRKRLCQLIIHNLLEQEPSKTITSPEFYSLSLNVTNIFKKESPAVYFSAYLAASNFQFKKNASGKLYETYITRRRKLRQGGIIKGRRSSSTSTSRTSSPVPVRPDADTDPVVEEKLTWLQNSVQPWQLVLQNWRDTATVRLKTIESGGNISDYFQKFPAIQQPEGYKLTPGDIERQINNTLEKALRRKICREVQPYI
ncbi:unnamed protein product [Brassicogethes aeneus]|uniref:SAM domain-containing protein n=1 Tax=Brassicogethes aeneus TaxID=1431903 RepID=A0A9P0FLE2_BRAAE|nr:unnamed protein product [Brassicogethes aeneus]